MRKMISILLMLTILTVTSLPLNAASRQELDSAVYSAAEFILRTVQNPEIGTVGGEWSVIGLARSGHDVPDEYYERYHRAVARQVRESGGVLDERRHTEYSRVILGLTAAGYDPRDIGGFDLTIPLGDFERTLLQGINGPIFALIALDSADYDIPQNRAAQTQATREMYLTEILRRQTRDGGWNLTAGANGSAVGRSERGDPDITGMALQALAKYQDDNAARAATNRALAFLSRIQDDHGGFSGDFSRGVSSVESAAQVLVALTELAIPVDDKRFVKKGNSILDNILSFQNEDGSFSRSSQNMTANMMATEQALYALAAAQRATNGQSSMLRMSGKR